MKYLIMTLFLSLSIFSFGQNTVYKENGSKEENVLETVKLELTPSDIPISIENVDKEKVSKKFNSLPLGPISEIAKEIISFGYKIGTDVLETEIQKFTGEYEKENSFIEFDSGKMPQVQFIREVTEKKITYDALSFTLKPDRSEKLNYFYYSISDFKLLASKAKSTRRSSVFDYSIELQLTYVQDTVAKTITLPPVQIHSVGYGVDPLSSMDPKRYRTDFVPIPENSYVVKIGVKVIETNPQKVKAQKFLDIWNETPGKYKDSVDDILTLILKKED